MILGSNGSVMTKTVIVTCMKRDSVKQQIYHRRTRAIEALMQICKIIILGLLYFEIYRLVRN